MTDYDIIIIGGGMAGASLGAEVAADARVLILEMEDVAGYHATGRSVAFWTESYGGPGVQPLTSASGPLLENPDTEFSNTSFLAPRGAIHIGRSKDADLTDNFMLRFEGTDVALDRLDAVALAQRIPGLRAEWTVGISEPSTADIDVAALHSACLRQFNRRGGTLHTGSRLMAASHEAGRWQIDTSHGTFSCNILVNAAGAWADDIARLCGIAPIGIRPLRRTVVQLRIDPEAEPDLPLVLDLAGKFYFKPAGAGRIWLSPHDEEPSAPCDAAPDEMAIATAIDRLHQAVDWRVRAVERKWAGLRSFSPDRLPVYGYDGGKAPFFWFAGQGGFGIQTAPAAARLGASLLMNAAAHDSVSDIDPVPYGPLRFAKSVTRC
ncbi:FAD-dependent oxidoreductase [Sphingobium sp. SCG-1]|uniref:NAD(P)/FAD-dependent oxidoreductase n=1 Tax=Sphingobium sp. SCG-1 TaxID=2072936 RepID=UPI000CD6B620|nr:FAD-dependent oxidoreductase [Sphingobium sp. SCG-1]AUW59868.1 FAD-dependent oxidoreductase [Sphingobium sp. SCG-1]